MNQKGIAPVLIIILIALGIGGYLVQSKHTRFKQEPTATPTNNETAQQSGSNDQQKISDKFTYQDIQRTQTGPTHYFCYPDEITSQQNNNLIGFNCSRQDENMNCQLSNSKTLIKTATSEFVNIHYKCERGNAYGEPGGYICRSEDGKILQFSQNPRITPDLTYDEKESVSTNQLVLKYKDGSVDKSASWKGASKCTYPVIITKDYKVYLRCEPGGPSFSVKKIDLTSSSVSEVEMVRSFS